MSKHVIATLFHDKDRPGWFHLPPPRPWTSRLAHHVAGQQQQRCCTKRAAVRSVSGTRRASPSSPSSSSSCRRQYTNNGYLDETNAFNLDELSLQDLEQIARERHSEYQQGLQAEYD
ncbi:hypothetical protein HDU77_006299, partial [Chytriomyces hyalinus]